MKIIFRLICMYLQTWLSEQFKCYSNWRFAALQLNDLEFIACLYIYIYIKKIYGHEKKHVSENMIHMFVLLEYLYNVYKLKELPLLHIVLLSLQDKSIVREFCGEASIYCHDFSLVFLIKEKTKLFNLPMVYCLFIYLFIYNHKSNSIETWFPKPNYWRLISLKVDIKWIDRGKK